MISQTEIKSDYEHVFYLQKANQAKVAECSVAQRIAKLQALKAVVLKYQTEIQTALYQDFKKHPAEADMTEVLAVVTEVKFAIKNLRAWLRPERVGTPTTLLGTSSYIHREPKGLVLIISPWNFPFNLTLCHLVSAIAAGNCVMIKPSEMTPHSAALMRKMLAEVFEESEVALFEGDASVSSGLMKLPFNHIFFTGSPQIGKVVMRAAAEHLCSVTLELGGKCPVVVDETADLDDAAAKIMWTKCMNNGQICISPDYVMVHESRKDALVAAMITKLKKNYGETAEERATSPSFCRIVNERHHQRLSNCLDDATQKGARVLFGGNRNVQERYLEPTLLDNVNDDMIVMQDELFGPLLPIVSYTNEEEVVQKINRGEKPLAMYIFSKNNKNIQKLITRTSAGGTCINECAQHFYNVYLPFGGVNFSGIGKSKGKFGFDEFCNQRAVLTQHLFRFNAMKLLHPPYNERTTRLVQFIMRWL